MMDPRCFIRLCLNYDGTVQSAFYQIKPRIWWRILLWLTRTRLSRSIDFETEFSDGSFVMTSNAEGAAVWDSPPLIFAEFLPAQTPLKTLLEKHRTRIAEHADTTGAQPLECRTLKEMLESQHRMEEIKSEFRRRVGWAKKSEWDKIAVRPHSTTDEIYGEFTKLRNEIILR